MSIDVVKLVGVVAVIVKLVGVGEGKKKSL